MSPQVPQTSNVQPPNGLSALPATLPPGPSPTQGSLSLSAPRISKDKGPGAYNYWEGCRSLSGFKHLSSLSLTGICSLDYLYEIRDCLKSCSATLTHLSLSLSRDLALKSQKVSEPPPSADDTSDTDEDHTAALSSQPISFPASQGKTESDVRKAKFAQDAILAEIFDMQSISAEGRKLERNLTPPTNRSNPSVAANNFIKDLHAIAEFQKANVSRLQDDSTRRAFLEMLQHVCRKYLDASTEDWKLESGKARKITGNKSPSQPQYSSKSSLPPPKASGVNTGNGTPSPFAGNPPQTLDGFDFDAFLAEEMQMPTGSWKLPDVKDAIWKPLGLAPPPSTSFSNVAPLSTLQGSSSQSKYPTTFDEHMTFLNTMHSALENTLDTLSKESQSHGSKVGKYSLSSTGKLQESATLPAPKPPSENSLFDNEGFEGVDVDIEHPDEDSTEPNTDQEMLSDQEEHLPSPSKKAKITLDMSSEFDLQQSRDMHATGQMAEESCLLTNEDLPPDQAMHEWIRTNHGFKLKEFKIQYIPLKASLVGRALDLDILKRITLLNAGNQEPFWKLLTRLQATRSTRMAFESIHTDSVSSAFLTFLTTFEGLTELFLMERSQKTDLDPTNIKTVVDIKDIRRIGLQNHLGSLKKIMIRNDASLSWDLDGTTILTLATQTKQLKELAISLSSKNSHILIQNISEFKELKALHLLAVRGASSGAVAQLEFLNSIVDSISQKPQKIEFLAIENSLAQVVRSPYRSTKQLLDYHRVDKERASKGKGKAKEETEVVDGCLPHSKAYDEPLIERHALKLRLSRSPKFQDVRCIRIFTNEVRNGTLWL
ncbi:MAG: hypothetical protein Q9167_007088 [Letrouitia subvulpina]